NWIIGHTDRFKAAVTQRSLSNLVSFWGTTDAGVYFGDAEFPGHPFDGDNIQFYIEKSPITYVSRMNTPLLILHSEKDYRCMIEQAEQLFIALKQRHKDVQMVRFPNESHGLSRMGQPRHRIERLERIIGWFDAKL
ncbi:MAG: peptidase S9 family protein, partial [Candidatus Chloroheliales bacterium]